MAFDLLDSVRGFFTGDLIDKAASSLSESKSGISQALSGIIPSVIGGIISKATANSAGASGLLTLAKGASASGLPANPGELFGKGGGDSLLSNGLDQLKQLLGDKAGGITAVISRFSGISESSVSSLMALVTPVALGILGKHAVDNHLSPESLSNILSTQKASVAAAIPSGLGSLPELTGLSRIINPAPSHSATAHTEKKADSGRRWAIPLVSALAIVALVWLIIRGCSKEETVNVSGTDTVAIHTPSTVDAAPVSIKVTLPDGVVLDAYKGGIEDRLVAYLNSTDPADSISNSRWFDFDNLNFKTGSAELTEESMKQVGNIAAILKAYPKATIKIGGYTDKTGNEEDNLKLSQRRANSVLDAVKKIGAAENRLAGAEGYGSQFAKAAIDAPDEERKSDRRISVSVRNK